MDRHTPWSDQIEAVLQSWGARKADREAIRRRQKSLCEPDPGGRLLLATPRLQKVLFSWGVSPHDTLAIIQYLDALTDRRPTRVDPVKRAKNTQSKRKWREEHRDEYNERQKLLMRQRRADEKARKTARSARTSDARLARWPQPAPSEGPPEDPTDGPFSGD